LREIKYKNYFFLFLFIFFGRFKRIEKLIGHLRASKNVDEQKPPSLIFLEEHYPHDSHLESLFWKFAKLLSISMTPKQAIRHPKTKPTYDQKLTFSISS